MLKKIFFAICFFVFACVFFYYLVRFYLTIGEEPVASIQSNEFYISDLQFKNDILFDLDTCFNQLKSNDIVTKSKLKIILCTTNSRYNLKTLYLKKGTLGVNQSLFNVIILAPADYKNNKQIKRDEKLINRRLSDAIVHEITHSYVKEKIGFFNNLTMDIFQKWKIEGFCEYVANSSSFDINEGKRIFLENGDEQEELKGHVLERTYFYFKSRLKVDYLLSYKKLSFDELINTNFDEEQIENEIRGALKEGRYYFNKQ